MQVDLAVTAVAGRNGNTLVFGHGLLAECADLTWPLDPAALGTALATRRAAGRPRPVLAVVFPYSSHNYLLRHFLAQGDIDPDHDVELIVLPPSALPEALAEGTIDGFCAGEPWGSRAVDLQVGRIVLSTSSIWPNHPEKLLAFRADAVARDPGPAVAVTAALIQATAWLADPANADKAATILHRTALPGVPASVIALALRGELLLGAGEPPIQVPGAIRFAAAATRPAARHFGWMTDAMRRWGHVPAVGVADPSRPDLWQRAASQAELPDLPTFADAPPGI